MRATVLALAVVLLAATASGAEEAATNEALLQEIRALRAEVEALSRQVEQLAAGLREQTKDREAAAARGDRQPAEWEKELKQQIEQAAAPLRQAIKEAQAAVLDDDLQGGPLGRPADRAEWRGPNLEALRKIKLPENPTKEQARQYVWEILAISERQNSFSSTDPQRVMLARVGPENVDILVDALAGGPASDMYIMAAVNRLAREEHKQIVLDALPFTHGLAEVVLRKGWAEDARETLLAELRTGPTHLPREWIQAVCSLRDPTTYPDMLKFFVWGDNRWETYRTIRLLPGIDLDKAVADAWAAAGMNDDQPWETQALAAIAIRHGIVEALEFALEGPADDGYWDREMRRAVQRHTEARGTQEQVRQWFRENRGNLVWDAEARVFRVGEGE